MAKNTEYSKVVEDYLNGDMSGSQKEMFETQLSSDPMLQSELSHQSEVIEGLESFRKAELKTRLAAINVNPTILGVISQSAMINSVTTVATTALIATGAYYYFDSPSMDFELDRINSVGYVLDEATLPESRIELTPVETKKISPVVITPKSQIADPTVEAKVEAEENDLKEALSFNIPNSPDDIESDIIPSTEEILESNTNNLEELSGVVKLDRVEIENIIDKKYGFHYRYLDGRLYLYGKFDKSPYEIIEINARSGKRLFFYYQDRYYKIEKATSEITAFETILDQELIKELNILKVKK